MEKAEESKSKSEQPIDEKAVLKQAAGAILQEGIDFYLDFENPNILRRIGILPKSKKYIIKPLVLGTLIRISKIMVDLDLREKVNEKEFIVKGIEIMAQHTEQLLDVVVLAIHNSEGKPKPGLKRIFRKNLKPEELLELVTYVITQMDVSNFMKSIALIKGASLFEARG